MTSSNPLQQTIEALAKEKGIEPDVVIQAMEEAVLTASRKYYKIERGAAREVQSRERADRAVRGQDHRRRGDQLRPPRFRSAEAKEMYGEDAEVEVGYQIEFPKRTDVLGRIAAQTAKQVIFQKVREAEREIIFAEYNQRVGEVMNGIVKRFEQGDIIVEVGRVEAILPRKEQSRAESYTQGDRLRAVIKGVSKSAKGPQIVLSRTDPALLIKLFEQEVPEIYDGTVMIRGAVREAGDRAKVAVFSRERDVDPVGACVGMKGTRVQAIIRELRGEKIDIVEWSDDPVRVRDERAVTGQGPARHDRRRPGQGHGGRGRGQAVVAGHRQEGPERPTGRQAHRLAHRHQERRGKAQGSRGAARSPRDPGGRDRRRRHGRQSTDGRDDVETADAAQTTDERSSGRRADARRDADELVELANRTKKERVFVNSPDLQSR